MGSYEVLGCVPDTEPVLVGSNSPEAGLEVLGVENCGYDCKSYGEDQTVFGKESLLVKDWVIAEDKGDGLDTLDDFTSYLSTPPVDSDEPLGDSMPGIVLGKSPVRDMEGGGDCSTENGEGDQAWCLESGGDFCLGKAGLQLEDDAVGSSPEKNEIPLTSLAPSTQSGDLIQSNNDADTKFDNLEAAVRSHFEIGPEKLDVLDREKPDSLIQTQHGEDGSSDCTIGLSDSSPFFQVSGNVDNRSHIQLVPNQQERYGSTGDPNCYNVANCPSLPEIETKETDNININLVSVSVASDAIVSPVRRSTRRNKFCLKDDTGNAAVSRRKAVNRKLVQGEKFLNVSRRKRSCRGKPVLSSIWGSMLNIIKVEDSELIQADGKRSNQVGDQRSHKKTVGVGNGRQNKNHGGSSSLSKDKCSNNHPSRIRLKVTIGGQNNKRALSAVQSELSNYPATRPSVGDKSLIKANNPAGEISEAKDGIGPNLENGLSDGKGITYADRVPGNPIFTGAHFLDSLHVEKDMESTVTQDTSAGNNLGYCPRVYPQDGPEVEEATGKQYSDPATSPDSEVISLTQNVSLSLDVLTTGQAVGSTDAAASNMELISSRKLINIGQVKGATDSLATSLTVEEKSLGQNRKNKFAKHRQQEKHVHGHTNGNDSRSSSNAERHTKESLELDDLGESLKVETANKSSQMLEQSFEVKSGELLVPKFPLDIENTIDQKPSSESSVEVRKQKSAASVSSRNRRKTSHEQKKSGQKSGTKKKVKEKDSPSKVAHDGKNHLETVGDINISSGTAEHLETQKPAELIKGESMGFEIPSDPVTSIGITFASDKSPVLPDDLNGQVSPPPNAWVRCDDCFKWRCIPTKLADHIEDTNCRWTCRDNMDKAFADCSIPQEKSNAEINAELEISEFSGDEDAATANPVAKGFEGKQLTVPKQAPWKPIESNLFLHRRRKTQTIDEIMICQCKPPLNGGLGCGDECLNRIINIECVRGTCPCGDRCSNQQFQQRKYAKLEHIRCGKKGYGLKLLESVSKGDFLIEYVGEVLDVNAYEARQREYASRGQRHFYFMTLNGSEVIDACAKGNLGRFINHSCDPNCCTEKWLVNGEVCIGLFALRNIKKGEELTFDYNYVRVFGAAVKKCVCGSSLCRGYIGGDPLNTDAVVLDDSDEEFPEPVMVDENGEAVQNTDGAQLDTILSDSEQLQNTAQIDVSALSIRQLESPSEKDGTASGSGDSVQSIQILPPKKDTVHESLSSVQPSELFIQKEVVMYKLCASSTSSDSARKSVSDHVMSKGKRLPDSLGDGMTISKARPLAKSSRMPASVKKGKSRSAPVVTSKPQAPLVTSKPQTIANKAKKGLEGVANSHSKGVEDKLNELLDSDGGISKRKDAAKGYLKLLVLTASCGDNVNGEAVQSTRDLSIILDALLKTKKLNVLNDIINKNGLQMLHNIMKQNRKNFNRTPIIRKLLKILEHLAEKKVLTLELINSPPPCDGMESFRESIFQLSNHSDTKVHRIARDFRDKWMPRSFRRNNYTNVDSIGVEQQAGLHGTSFPKYKQWCDPSLKAIANFDNSRQTNPRAVPPYVNIQRDHSGLSVNSYPGNGTRSRKRKSRWDHPEQGNSGPEPLECREGQKPKLIPSLQQPEIREAVQEHIAQGNDETVCDRGDHSISHPSEGAASVEQPVLDDAPPGFPSNLLVPCATPLTDTLDLPPDDHHKNCSCEVVTGFLQERYDSSLPVSFGIPLFFVEQLGIPLTATQDSWEISPSIPFHPFPPLPPYPRERNTRPPRTVNRLEHGESPTGGHRASCQPDADLPCTSGTLSSEIPNTGNYQRHMRGRMGVSSGNIGRRYFKQQKWNNRRPPYFRDRRDAWGFKGNHSRNRECSLEHEMENVQR